jgi:predicted ATPase
LRDLLIDASTGASSTAAAGPAALSAPPDDGFIGRRTEMNDLVGRLGHPGGRLVTLLGPGGVGKSRLARQVIERVRESFPGGAWWVELQDLADTSAVLARLAVQLGVALDERQDPVDRVASRLSGAPALVVFDNAEHLPGMGPLADRLLDATPRLAVLLTSRTRTRSAHEWSATIGGLDVPDGDSRDLEAASAFDAVRLFDARARAARRSFRLDQHLAAVIDIVEAVGGVPLAIELAAAWVRLLPPEEIARELHGSLAVLERDPALPREPGRPEHQSLRVVLDRTWTLLAPAERAALDALSVFRGGFTAGAAQAVAGVALPLLSSLVDQSAVAVDEAGRFSLHPLVASAAAERLRGDGERLATLQRLHAEHFARGLADLAPYARADHRVLLAGIDAEYANAWRAWAVAVENGRADLMKSMIAAWRTYFIVRGRFTEGVALLRPVLELPEHDVESQQAIAAARDALAMLLYRKGDLALSRTVAEAGVLVAERCGDRRALVGCLSGVGSCHSLAGRWQEAQPYFERALQVAREDGQRAEMAGTFTNLGICAKKEGRFQQALEYYDRALAIDRELGHHDAVARRLNNIGNVYMELCDWETARRIMAQGLQHCEQYRIESMRPYFEASLGLTSLELGELDAAEPHLHRAYELACATDTVTIQISSQSFLARIESLRGRAAESLARLQAVAKSAQTSGNATDVLDTALYYGEWLRDRGRRIEAVRVWRMVIDHPIAEAGIRDSARQWTTALGLGEDEVAEAARRPPSLDAAIAALLAERVNGKR